jgi:hypothetical protein
VRGGYRNNNYDDDEKEGHEDNMKMEFDPRRLK